MSLVLQFAGAAALLAAFVALLAGAQRRSDWSYLVLNCGGGALLTADALIERQWGFVLLQGVWALVAAWGIATKLRAAR